jgi:hypothetical protein
VAARGHARRGARGILGAVVAPRIPVGIDDFRTLREAGLEYVDKTDLIRQILDRAGVEALLLPRPRRFGKTLNLSMLRCWLEKTGEDASPLFEGLSIWQAGEAYRAHFQRYPVIHLSFKETKFEHYDRVAATIRKKIQVLFDQHRYLRDSERLSERERRDFGAVLDGTEEQPLHDRALADLSAYLHAHHGEKVVILIDEYDEPIHAGHVHGYAPQILDFMRAFLGSGLKSNPHLFKAVMTGVLRVAKENLFSGLNNLGVYTLLETPFNTCFGFTEAEVTVLLERSGRADKIQAVRAWYNGYLFGGEVVYNPWSVCCFLDRGSERPQPYWLSTSSNDLVRELLELYALDMEPVFEALLEGGSVDWPLEENVPMSEIRADKGALYSLLVFSGYLKAEALPRGDMEHTTYRLSVPNFEVLHVYTTTFERWMSARLRGHGGSVEELSAALLGGDAEAFEEQLQAFVTDLLSFHDPGKVRPERVYQGFVLGLLAAMEPEYVVRSNRESGEGRPDVTIRPRKVGKPGAVLELKVAKKGKKTPAAALREGLSQIAEKGYAAELLASGVSPVHAFAVAFDGKRVWVKAAEPGAAKKKARRRR